IFMRPEFRQAAAKTALIRSPVEWFVAACSALDIPPSATQSSYYLTLMGQPLFNPPNVSGWPRSESWLAPSPWQARGAAAGHIRSIAVRSDLPYNQLLELTPKTPPEAVPNVLFDKFGIVDPSPV